MESRRIVLLTEGYLNGWLTFDEKTPASKVREDYILGVIERKNAMAALQLKATVEASVISGALTNETVKMAYDNYNAYLALALPYMAKPDKIKSDGKAMDKAQADHWKKFLKDSKKRLKTSN